MTLDKLNQLWAELGDIPVNEREEITEPFYGFDVGTHREHIWTWFEGQNRAFVVADKLYN